ncbi:MAG TPA: lysylphosphatidylglycerol synthase transmembrane domain-containing protein [Anaerolineales bacterium]|nr:lysylphosphatidylglycerol synthase transmembrane domain-containing protein [Anaerolineales bacterium]
MLALALLVYLLIDQGWAEIGAAVRQIDGWRFGLAILLVGISRLAVAGRWQVLIQSAGTGIRVAQSIQITFAGLFAANFLPTTIGGDVVRLAWVIRLGCDRAVSVASLVADRLVGMAGMAMALPFGLPSTMHYFQAANHPASIPNWLALPWLRPLQTKVTNFTRRTLQVLQLWMSKPKALLLALAFTWVHMLCTFGIVWLMLGGMGEQISFWLVMGLWSAAYFVTLLPISINGMGVQELAMTFFYTTLGGISAPNGLTLALLMRLIQMLASLPGALFLPQILAGRRQVE